uniref:Uncharacterized protein n=1 Tax=Anopheles coluzzii TaxID=1518534 RepID=A0A8W7PEK6_ANOCL
MQQQQHQQQHAFIAWLVQLLSFCLLISLSISRSFMLRPTSGGSGQRRIRHTDDEGKRMGCTDSPSPLRRWHHPSGRRLWTEVTPNELCNRHGKAKTPNSLVIVGQDHGMPDGE